MSDSEHLIPVGKIIGTHGIRGQMKLHSYSGNHESLVKGCPVYLKSPGGALQEFTIRQCKAAPGRFIISLADFDDINRVEAFVGSELCIKRCHLPELAEDEYYWNDLIGLQVQTDDGTVLGTVTDIFETGSSDIYVVQGDGREYLIPAIADVIQQIDLGNSRITITPLEGLLDL